MDEPAIGADVAPGPPAPARRPYSQPGLSYYGSVATSTEGTPALIYDGDVQAVHPDY